MKKALPAIVVMIIAFISCTITAYAQDTLQSRAVVTQFLKQQASVHYISYVAMHPNGTSVAVSYDSTGSQVIRIISLANNNNITAVTAATNGSATNITEAEPQWNADGSKLAFLSDAQSSGQQQVYIADGKTARLLTTQPLTHSTGYVSHLKWSPDNKFISVLLVENASREPSPMAAENKAVGLIDSNINRNIQRLATVDVVTGETRIITPAGLYVFEYDWSPDSKQMAFTAAMPPGDDNWYIAKLYRQTIGMQDTTVIYAPQFQIALPRWSPDGKRIAFIEGLMSDQGGTGGEIYTVATSGNTKRVNLTPGRASTPSWYAWRSDTSMLFTEFTGGSVAINSLNTATLTITNVWRADASIRASNEETSLAIATNKKQPVLAFAHATWSAFPEVYFGTGNNLKKLTHLNDNIKATMPKAENVTWRNDAFNVQGWLLYPTNFDATKKYPMLVCVHGGPAWITTPTWSAPDFNTTVYTQLGYFVFFPNPRGSYGQGEAFTLANRRDWGFGDLRDILTGVDTVVATHAIDNNRIGILGWSYGGSMAMFAITQTKRFAAAVAGAGAADWLSYYGQNAIDKWMRSYFNASPYDDPAAYAKSSAMTYIKNAATPTLVLVGERDGEAPSPQSFQFWHALKELNVPTQLMVYPDEGHSFFKFEDMIDVSARTIEWFDLYLKKK